MQRKRPYHHRNLKKTLLDAAVKVIARVGPRAFTLREVARLAKVSHNAPYRHFRDKEEMLAAVAAEGFERLAASMIEEAAPARDPLDALVRSGLGYVQFALRWPDHFTVMFDYCEGLDTYPDYEASGRKAFQVLLDRIVDAQTAGQLPPGDADPLALICWSMVHGIAKLAVSNLLPFDSEKAAIEFTAFATRALAEGIGSKNTTSSPAEFPAKSAGRKPDSQHS